MRIFNQQAHFQFATPFTHQFHRPAAPAPVSRGFNASWFAQLAGSQQNMFQGWASFGGGFGFSPAPPFAQGNQFSFGGGSNFNFSAFGGGSSYNGSTDLASVFGSGAFTNSTNLGDVFGQMGGGSAFGGGFNFDASLNNIYAQMYAIAGQPIPPGGIGAGGNPFTAGLMNTRQQLLQLAMTPPSPFSFF